MRLGKKSSRPCPNCHTSLPRQNFKNYLNRCQSCTALVCTNCSFSGLCLDCFTDSTSDVIRAEYYIEKYGTVTPA